LLILRLDVTTVTHTVVWLDVTLILVTQFTLHVCYLRLRCVVTLLVSFTFVPVTRLHHGCYVTHVYVTGYLVRLVGYAHTFGFTVGCRCGLVAIYGLRLRLFGFYTVAVWFRSRCYIYVYGYVVGWLRLGYVPGCSLPVVGYGLHVVTRLHVPFDCRLRYVYTGCWFDLVYRLRFTVDYVTFTYRYTFPRWLRYVYTRLFTVRVLVGYGSLRSRLRLRLRLIRLRLRSRILFTLLRLFTHTVVTLFGYVLPVRLVDSPHLRTRLPDLRWLVTFGYTVTLVDCLHTVTVCCSVTFVVTHTRSRLIPHTFVTFYGCRSVPVTTRSRVVYTHGWVTFWFPGLRYAVVGYGYVRLLRLVVTFTRLVTVTRFAVWLHYGHLRTVTLLRLLPFTLRLVPDTFAVTRFPHLCGLRFRLRSHGYVCYYILRYTFTRLRWLVYVYTFTFTVAGYVTVATVTTFYRLLILRLRVGLHRLLFISPHCSFTHVTTVVYVYVTLRSHTVVYIWFVVDLRLFVCCWLRSLRLRWFTVTFGFVGWLLRYGLRLLRYVPVCFDGYGSRWLQLYGYTHAFTLRLVTVVYRLRFGYTLRITHHTFTTHFTHTFTVTLRLPYGCSHVHGWLHLRLRFYVYSVCYVTLLRYVYVLHGLRTVTRTLRLRFWLRCVDSVCFTFGWLTLFVTTRFTLSRLRLHTVGYVYGWIGSRFYVRFTVCRFTVCTYTRLHLRTFGYGWHHTGFWLRLLRYVTTVPLRLLRSVCHYTHHGLRLGYTGYTFQFTLLVTFTTRFTVHGCLHTHFTGWLRTLLRLPFTFYTRFTFTLRLIRILRLRCYALIAFGYVLVYVYVRLVTVTFIYDFTIYVPIWFIRLHTRLRLLLLLRSFILHGYVYVVVGYHGYVGSRWFYVWLVFGCCYVALHGCCTLVCLRLHVYVPFYLRYRYVDSTVYVYVGWLDLLHVWPVTFCGYVTFDLRLILVAGYRCGWVCCCTRFIYVDFAPRCYDVTLRSGCCWLFYVYHVVWLVPRLRCFTVVVTVYRLFTRFTFGYGCCYTHILHTLLPLVTVTLGCYVTFPTLLLRSFALRYVTLLLRSPITIYVWLFDLILRLPHTVNRTVGCGSVLRLRVCCDVWFTFDHVYVTHGWLPLDWLTVYVTHLRLRLRFTFTVPRYRFTVAFWLRYVGYLRWLLRLLRWIRWFVVTFRSPWLRSRLLPYVSFTLYVGVYVLRYRLVIYVPTFTLWLRYGYVYVYVYVGCNFTV